MMDWTKLLAMNRYLSEVPKTDTRRGQSRQLLYDANENHEERSLFCRDTDKIMFSSSFRRLGRKTQVHPLNDNDHIHTRSTHSLEVASVGRGIARRVARWLMHDMDQCKFGSFPSLYHAYQDGILQPTDFPVQIEDIGEIVFAACLAHDLGNPPFGHAGEKVIGTWFEDRSQYQSEKYCELEKLLTSKYKNDFMKFDGNAMAFRIVTKIEERQYAGGMKLTLPVLGTMLKYPWSSASSDDKMGKFSAFKTETDDIALLADNLGLKQVGESKYARHPLAHIVELADDICYNIMDLEDAFELKIIDAKRLIDELRRVYNNDAFLNEKYPELNEEEFSKRRSIRLLRALIISEATKDACNCFVTNYGRIISGERDLALVNFIPEDTVFGRLLNVYNKEKKDIYSSRMKLMLEIGANAVMANLLDIFYQAVAEMKLHKKTFFSERVGNMCKDHFNIEKVNSVDWHEAFILVLDYLAGMSDHYAREVHEMFLGLGRAR